MTEILWLYFEEVSTSAFIYRYLPIIYLSDISFTLGQVSLSQ